MHKQSVRPKRPILIGICGSSHRTGATTVALAFSTFLSSGANKWVACVELNESGAFNSLLEQTKRSSIRRNGIDFFPDALVSDIAALKSTSYDVLVIDFGVLNRSTFSEFITCDLCLVLGYMSPWNRKTYQTWIERISSSLKKQSKEIILLGNLSSLDETKQFHRQYGYDAVAVPFMDNPFQLSSNNWKFIERALERNKYTTNLLFSSR